VVVRQIDVDTVDVAVWLPGETAPVTRLTYRRAD